MRNTLIAIFSLFLIAACGFQPMYGKSGGRPDGVEDHLSLIEINNIPDQEGQFLRNALIDRLYRESRPINPQYYLNIGKIQEALINLDITKSSNTTRGQLRLTSNLILIDKQTGEALLTRDLQSITSYNILESEFATRVSENNARENALRDLARQIELQLNLYFRRL